MNPLVSVIIPTKDSAATLGACIESVKNQTYKHIDCIVVDNYSTDATKEVADQDGIIYIRAGNERSAQRNIGAQQSKGEYVCFIDSDMVLSPTVLQECVDIMEKNKSLIALSIPEESFGTTFWAQCKKFERSCYAHIRWMHAVRFMTKQSFIAVSGFNTHLVSGEDFDIHNRIEKMFGTHSVGLIKSIIYHNEGALSLRKTLKKKYYYGKHIYDYMHADHNTYKSISQTSLLRRLGILCSQKEAIKNQPIIFLGTCLMKILEFIAGGMGYTIGRITNVYI